MELDSKASLSESAGIESKAPGDQLAQLESAKQLALSDLNMLPQVFDSIVMIVQSITDQGRDSAQLASWCLEFFITVFSDSRVESALKRSLGCKVLVVVLDLVKIKRCVANVRVFQHAIELSSLIFTQVFLSVIKNEGKFQESWSQLQELKALLLSKINTNFPISDAANTALDHFVSLKVVLFKFIGVVVQTQLPTPPRDPRKRERKPANAAEDVSISMAKNHPLVNDNLKAEAMGLLDLLLNIVTESQIIVVQVNSAIFHILAILVKKRPSVVNKILSQLVMYDSFRKSTAGWDFELKDKQANKLKNKLTRRFSDRSFKIFLNFLFKNGILTSKGSSSNNDKEGADGISSKYYGKINAVIQYQDKQRKDKNLALDLPEDVNYYKRLDRQLEEERQKQKLSAVLEKSNLQEKDLLNISKHYPKVSLEDMYNDGKPAAKRSYSSLYTLTDSNNDLNNFDVSLLNNNILSQLVTIAISKTQTEKLSTALNIVSERYRIITEKGSGISGGEENGASNKRIKLDQDAQISNANGNGIIGGAGGVGIDSSLDYVLPEPKLMTFKQKKEHLNFIISNYLRLASSKELRALIDNQDDSTTNGELNGNSSSGSAGIIKMSKVAISKWEKNSWAVLLVRLATRGLYNSNNQEENQQLSDLVREALFTYFLESIQSRMDVVIEWLNEEWYSEYVKSESEILKEHNFEIDDAALAKEIKTPRYIRWTIKILDSIIPFLETKDRKIFIRLFSDLPYLNKEIILKLKTLCADRLRFNLGLQTLQYLIMVRPPVKDDCIELLQDLYENEKDNTELLTAVEKLLKKYKPEALSEETDAAATAA